VLRYREDTVPYDDVPLYSRLRPNVRDRRTDRRQTDRHQTKASLDAPTAGSEKERADHAVIMADILIKPE